MKTYLYVALLLVVLAAAKWAHSSIYASGYNAAVVKQAQEISKIKDEAIAQAKLEWDATVVVGEEVIIREEVIVEKIREVEKIVPRIVKEIVTVTPECSSLPQLASLFGQQASASNGGPLLNPDLTP